MDTSSAKYDKIFYPYAEGAHVKMCHKNKSEDKTPNLQSQGTDARTDMSDSKLDCVVVRDAPKSMIMKSS